MPLVVAPDALLDTVLLQSGGLLLPGATFAEVARESSPANATVRGALSFNRLLGPARHLWIDADGVKAAVRRYFAWEPFVEMVSRVLAQMRTVGPDAGPRRFLTEASLADTWPAEILNSAALLRYLETRQRSSLSVSEQGLLALLVDALAAPWDVAQEVVAGERVVTRLARCAMIASEVLDVRGEQDGAIALFAPDALLGLGRIREVDLPRCALVRAHELYVELLPQYFEQSGEIFAGARGMSIASWIHGAMALAASGMNLVEQGGGTRIDLRQAPPTPAMLRVRQVAHRLSRTREEFRDAYGPLLAQPINPGLAFLPLRETPLLRVDHERYISLHADFLQAASDDGVFFGILNALARTVAGGFLAAAGLAFEQYVLRVLQRCAAASATQVVRVPQNDRGRNRCDFAWRIGHDLLLLDAKRFGLGANLVMGDIRLAERMLDDVGHALQQFAETVEDMRTHGMPAVIPALAGWMPQRVFAAAISHKPMYAWFDAADRITAMSELPRPWSEMFAARPAVWSISDLEQLEAALPVHPLERLLADLAQNHPITYLDLRTYLREIGWRGPHASEYYAARAREILAQHADSWSPGP
jgi:hypothetical protein